MGRKARLKQTRTIDPRPIASSAAQPAVGDWSARDWTIVALLVALTFVVFGPVASHSFLNFDDGQFIYENPETLFAHTLAVTHDNPVAEYNLGQTLQATKPDEAMPHLQRAIALTQPLLTLPGATKPDWYPQAYVGLGTAMLMKARPLPQSPARDALIRDAIANYRQALAIDPNTAHAKNNIVVATQMQVSR